MCMVMRGVEKTAATTLSSCMLGDFKTDKTLRAELLSMISWPALSQRGGGATATAPEVASTGTAQRGKPAIEDDKELATPNQQNETQAVPSTSSTVSIMLAKEDMKFSAGHFTIFEDGARERLHGHNFHVSAKVTASADVSSNNGGLVVDYGALKRHLRSLCDEWDEVLLIPGQSQHLRVETLSDDDSQVNERVKVVFKGKTRSGDRAHDEMILPAGDVLVLPVSNITGEELSRTLLSRFVQECGDALQKAKVESIEIGVSSGPGQVRFGALRVPWDFNTTDEWLSCVLCTAADFAFFAAADFAVHSSRRLCHLR